MLFNSYVFILLFLPLALLGWHILNHLKLYFLGRIFLIGMSLWFYGWFNIRYLPLIIISILVNYLLHKALCVFVHNKAVLAVGVLFNLGLLFYYKYFDFFVENISHLTGNEPVLRGLILPLGISFFTFQQLGFLIDTKRGEAKRPALDEYALFVTFFPQLIAGPIVTHDEMMEQFNESQKRGYDPELVAVGIYSFSMGLGKKVLLADVFGRCVDVCYGMDNLNGGSLLAFLLVIAYALQLYFDFSGYCDMARGLGFMFGVVLPVNFDAPYKAENPVEFWRRWHITLGRFFTKYVYIPLGGNRKGLKRTCLNLMVVFVLSGIWHGAGWTFIIWGLLHGMAQVVYRIKESFNNNEAKKEISKKRNPIANILNFMLMSLLWVIFRAKNLSQALSVIGGLIPWGREALGIPPVFYQAFRMPEFFYILKMAGRFMPDTIDKIIMWIYFFVGMGIVFFAPSLSRQTKTFKASMPKALAAAFVFLWALVSLSGVSSFLYFNF